MPRCWNLCARFGHLFHAGQEQRRDLRRRERLYHVRPSPDQRCARTGSNPVVCTASDQCHDVGTCAPATGTCSTPAKANGATCDDSNACTQTDTCQSGACTGANPVVRVASDQCHDIGTCAPATGTCSAPAKANGVICDDGNACTQTDSCQS